MGLRTNSWLFMLLVVLCVLVPIFGLTVPVKFNEVTIENVIKLLATIFVVTLFMERAQEVILTTLRARSSEILELAIRKHKRVIQRIKRIDPDQVVDEALYDRLEEARVEKMEYRSYTRVLALRLGLLLGLLISIAGVRSLGVLVDQATLLELGRIQLALFNVVDVLLTGGVIAGGSDGIHKMTELYRSYVDINVKRNKRKKREMDVADS
ncbi:hypothetical protein A9Q99_16615 [Gammaproteobacteria bacterium 45_16_T64]|nr:hypothetical protein A9Q99_16615 [Gammaproteobacteria bacterium 45_16_T64]